MVEHDSVTITDSKWLTLYSTKKWRCAKGHEFTNPNPVITFDGEGVHWETGPLCWKCFIDLCDTHCPTEEVGE